MIIYNGIRLDRQKGILYGNNHTHIFKVNSYKFKLFCHVFLGSGYTILQLHYMLYANREDGGPYINVINRMFTDLKHDLKLFNLTITLNLLTRTYHFEIIGPAAGDEYPCKMKLSNVAPTPDHARMVLTVAGSRLPNSTVPPVPIATKAK